VDADLYTTSYMGDGYMKEITSVEGEPVCQDCHCIMFKKVIQQSTIESEITGWSCPKCFTTRWGLDK